MSESVLIVGAGQGLSESLARLCVSKDIKVALAARNITKLDNLMPRHINVIQVILKVFQIFLRKRINQ